MDVRQLKMFVAVAEEGSIRGAARRIYVAQPQVSQVVRQLERELATPLMSRSHHGIELTPAGLVLLDQARGIIRRMDKATAMVRDVAVGCSTISVGLMAGQVSAGELTVPILSTFRDANPNTMVRVRELTFDQQFSALRRGDVDVALVRPPCFEAEVEVEPLFTEPLMACMGARHSFGTADELSVEQVLDEPMIDLVDTPRGWADFWLLNELRGGPARSLRDTSAVTIGELRFAMMFEDVVMPVAASAWRHGLTSPELTAVPLTGDVVSQAGVAYRTGDHRRDVAAFVACAHQVARDLIDLVPGGQIAD